MNHASAARNLLRRCHDGALGTISRRLQGYPYVSSVPFMLDHDANPIMLISRLAEHTKNIASDPRVSLAAHAPAEDVQAAPRLTLLGSCHRALDRASLAARYLRYFPSSAALLELDFEFYRIVPVALRYIGGFGSAHWLSAETFSPPRNSIADSEDSVLEQANTDHAQALRECCQRTHSIAASVVRMIGLDCDGFDARADGELVRFEFPQSIHDAHGARSALAALARESRV